VAEFNLKIIKIFFVVVIAMLVLAMASGMNILRRESVFDWQKFAMKINYLKYKSALAAESGERPSSQSFAGKIQYAKSVPVLLYHGIITKNNWEEDGTNIALKDFQDQMYALKRAGYRTITISEFRDFMRRKKNLPDRSVLITFDDGRKDSYYEADPVFQALDFNAVMFLISGRSLGAQAAGNEFYLGKKELEDMLGSGRWEVQSHGDFDHDWMQIDPSGDKGHFMSNLLWIPDKERNETTGEAERRILADLENSKKKIERELGREVFAFAYPFNDYGQNGKNFPEARKFIAENVSAIYPLTFFQEELDEQVVNTPDPENFMIKRISVDSSIGANELIGILEDNREKTLPWKDTFWNDSGWRTKWGETKIWGDLTIGESEKQGGNMTILLGSSLWKDYVVRSKVQLTGKATISQVVRYRDEENFALCSFDATEISIQQTVKGENFKVAAKDGDYADLVSSENEIGAQAQGNVISCFLNGKKEIEASLNSPISPIGGIGYGFWDDLSSGAVARIKKVEAMPL